MRPSWVSSNLGNFKTITNLFLSNYAGVCCLPGVNVTDTVEQDEEDVTEAATTELAQSSEATEAPETTEETVAEENLEIATTELSVEEGVKIPE